MDIVRRNSNISAECRYSPQRSMNVQSTIKQTLSIDDRMYICMLEVACPRSLLGRIEDTGCNKSGCVVPGHICYPWWQNVQGRGGSCSSYCNHGPPMGGASPVFHVKPTCPMLVDAWDHGHQPHLRCPNQYCAYGHDNLKVRFESWQRYELQRKSTLAWSE